MVLISSPTASTQATALLLGLLGNTVAWGLNGLPQNAANPIAHRGSPPGQFSIIGKSATTFPLRFSSPASQKFYVNGAKLPFVEFDAGPSYSGLIPLSSDPNEKRKFFFWFWPAAQKVGADDLTFWTNGGPGCSSLESMLQETGPISWKFGQARPTPNPYSWTNATSMLYVEHPIGTGYSVGTPQVTNQTDVSRDLFGFFNQWLKVFPEMNGKNFWLSGESYAGYYVPYLADYIYNYQSHFNLKLRGMYLVNPTLSWVVLQEQIPVVPMVKRYEHVFAFNETFMATISRMHQECGYADYLEKYLVYPPPRGPFPQPTAGSFDGGSSSNTSCDTFYTVLDAAKLANPAFNIYQILDIPPAFWDVLDAPQRWPGMQGDAVYFNREDVKQALHVPTIGKWQECTHGVFPNEDQSLPPAVSILSSVIDRNKRSVIASGLTDLVMINEGTKLVLQNLTWGHDQGFRKPINQDFIIGGQGSTGRFATERGLTFVEMEKAGHMLPQYQPRGAFQLLQFLLGQAASPSASWPSV
ncbi:hypothetical protein MJO28_014696 [Puccinia striiformis f. sp. tritici]|uniref:Carboxypeptidase n=4 Tax=Puccinia striiformis TaxID=27350 RepID=A0A0L0VSS9_9BASI|nr:hypothetical protein Pst134EA_027058 [Puccinia striiformis f. sp. tritici]KAI9621055.1 hypothetical protein H4Q26_013248 [Puccinia striiformis f. sp. tritici PST-130]KNF02326.1 hypothetical protein PSTG_04529 [Puccinia striiformis f. sp. tritici PST-78]POW00224.1 hypothetical protein PSTT_13273 [Puccinia striiformis]KAH9443239.1 hypothetical protein Pst134EB_027589 [Puccinia striiformis f. sp. tritici]KAH9450351.1 hypothetical protein Pst134EA_027058 [Puccinia striiformis f. sp. tritici]